MKLKSILFSLALCRLLASSWLTVAAQEPASIPAAPLAGSSTVTQPTELDRLFSTRIRPLLSEYCLECHRGAQAEAMLDLTSFTEPADVVASHQTWSEIMHRVAAGEMPPSAASIPMPTEQQRQLVQWIEAFKRQEASRRGGDPGLVPMRRLSNSELNYTVRDLIGVDLRPAREFPVDPANEAGFDNSAESLNLSPALLNKSLAAARTIAEHMLLTPDGLAFAPHPVVTETDRDKYCVRRIVDFYLNQPTDIAEYFFAAWQERIAPQQFTLESFVERGLSPKYYKIIRAMLLTEAPVLPPDYASSVPATEQHVNTGLGPLAVVRRKWLDLPIELARADEARADCLRLRDWVVDLRSRLEPDIENLNLRGIHKGAQPLVLWKNDQYASYRQRPFLEHLPKLAPGADSLAIATALGVPDQEPLRRGYLREVERFCRIFPDAFYVSERGRDYVGNAKAQQEKGRLLSAGFHSMMGYYRDDEPLVRLILTPEQAADLDRLWEELDFVTSAPMRQYSGFVWFERTDSTTMRGPEFDFARAEDKSVTSPEMIERLAETYLAKADALGADEVVRGAIERYFHQMNVRIGRIEKARLLAQPHHVEAMLELAGRAFRRPLAEAERTELRSFYHQLRQLDGLTHEEAIQDLLVAILLSPQFNHRTDLASPGQALTALGSYDLASRLSYFLWSSLPDAELLHLAQQNLLRDSDVLRSQVRRMTQDDRIRGLATEFGGQWLGSRGFEQHNSVDRETFPSFDDRLRQSMYEEPIAFMDAMLRRDRSILDCLDAAYVIVDRPLARHYGLAWPVGADETSWQELPATDQRGGLLTMSVFLTQNAPGRRTSPVKRGYWVVKRLLGQHIPAPPPNVPELPEDEGQLGELSLRQLLERHRQHEACAGCHQRFDSLGLVFENYGPIGELRQHDLAGKLVDNYAEFPDGTSGQGVVGLKQYLSLQRQADFVDNFTRKLLTFALGRSLLLSDEPLLEQMRSELAGSGYRIGPLLETIVLSPQFLHKRGS